MLIELSGGPHDGERHWVTPDTVTFTVPVGAAKIAEYRRAEPARVAAAGGLVFSFLREFEWDVHGR
jgi:hypothetical protein